MAEPPYIVGMLEWYDDKAMPGARQRSTAVKPSPQPAIKCKDEAEALQVLRDHDAAEEFRKACARHQEDPGWPDEDGIAYQDEIDELLGAILAAADRTGGGG